MLLCSMQGNVSLAEGASRRSLFRETRKPLALLHETINIMGAGRFPEGQTEIPFEAEVRGIDGMVSFPRFIDCASRNGGYDRAMSRLRLPIITPVFGAADIRLNPMRDKSEVRNRGEGKTPVTATCGLPRRSLWVNQTSYDTSRAEEYK